MYSLACVLYEMIAGDPPFSGSTVQAILARELTGALPSLRPVRATVSPDLDRVVAKALAKVSGPRFDPLRGSPRFSQLLRRMNFAP